MSKVSAEEKLEPETNGAEGFQIPSNSDPHKTFNNDSVKKYYIIYDYMIITPSLWNTSLKG